MARIGLDFGVPVVDVDETDVDLVIGDPVLQPHFGERVGILAVVSAVEVDVREDLHIADGEYDALIDIYNPVDGDIVGTLRQSEVVGSVAVIFEPAHVERGDGPVRHAVHGL